MDIAFRKRQGREKTIRGAPWVFIRRSGTAPGCRVTRSSPREGDSGLSRRRPGSREGEGEVGGSGDRVALRPYRLAEFMGPPAPAGTGAPCMVCVPANLVA